jgi:PAS domain S-box-containing protein
MPHGRKIVLLATGLLCIYLVATVVYGPLPPGPLIVNAVELSLGVLAALASVNAAQRSARRLANRFWVLMACAWILWSIAQSMVTYYDVVLQKDITKAWDSDAVLFIFMAPMAMALLLDPTSEGKGFDWQTALDFFQVGILTLLAYDLYSNYLFHAEGGLSEYVWKAQTFRLSALVLAYVLRAALTRSPLVRALFTRMGACMLVYGVGESYYSYGEANWNLHTGHWSDLGFTVPLFLAVGVAATWVEPEMAEPSPNQGMERSWSWLRQNYSIVFPLAVLFIAARFGQGQRRVANAAVVVSFLTSLARLSVTQYRERAAVASRLQAEAKYRALVESIPAVTYVANAGVAGGWTYASPQIESLLGYTQEEWIAAPELWINSVHPDDRERVAEIDNGMSEPGQRYDVEYRILARDGRVLWVRDVASVLRGPQGGALLIQGLMLDVSERQEAGLALRESEAQLAHAQAIAHVGNWTLDLPTNRLSWSAELYRIHGLTPGGSLDSDSTLPTLHLQEVEMWRERTQEVLAGKPFRPFEYRLSRPDGSERIVHFLGCEVIYDTSGVPLRLVGALADVTEQRRAERAVHEWKERYEAAVLASGQIIYDWEPDRDRVTLGGSLDRTLGYAIGEIDSHAWWLTIVHDEDRAAYLQELERCIATKQPFHQRYRVRRKDGSYTHVADDGYFVLSPDGTVIRMVGFVADISEQLLLEERSRQSQKLEAVGLLAGSIAHDFNNSLNIISGYAELLTLQSNGSDTQDYAGRIQDAAKRGADLTGQLLAFSRKQVFSPTVVNLNTVISALRDVLRHVLRDDIDLVVRAGARLGNVSVDHTQIERVVLNLAANARDAMPKGGRLEIETSNATIGDEHDPQHSTMPSGKYVVLTIKDNGIGMDEATVARVFDPFFTTKAPGKGTGLGLASVYGIVNQSNGFIWVDSQLGVGTVFNIYLPRVNSALKAGSPETAGQATSHGTETILLVEDEDSLRNMTRDYLRTLGYSVLDAPGGLEALELSRRYSLPIDLVITDVLMPGMSGKEVAEQLCVIRPGLKVIYISGYPDDEIAHHGVLEPGIHFVQKPFSLSQLGSKIREVISHAVV